MPLKSYETAEIRGFWGEICGVFSLVARRLTGIVQMLLDDLSNETSHLDTVPSLKSQRIKRPKSVRHRAIVSCLLYIANCNHELKDVLRKCIFITYKITICFAAFCADLKASNPS